MINIHPRQDPYGRLVYEGRAGLISPRRLDKLRKNNAAFVRAPRNGRFDPMSYYHLVDMLLQIPYDERFSAADLAQALNQQKKMFQWDPRTVGAILADLHESLEMASPVGSPAIRRINTSNHVTYAIQRFPHTDTYLLDTLLDLGELVASKNPEHSHDAIKRVTRSPLEFCQWLNPPV